ncbi:MAG: pyridoxal phosphate-dependent class II aminotransferase [Firmicutes bacterium]|nr:pyridoxal phosphate-dependent class II aminotransferase [Bacillota bacterium]
MNNGKIDNIHGGNIEAAWRSYGKIKFLDLSVSINPWGPSLKLWLDLLINLKRVREYPEPYSECGRRLIANYFTLTEANIALGNGAAELIGILPQTLPVNRAVVLEPTFTEYRRAFEEIGKPVRRIPLTDDFEIPLPTVASELQKGDLLFICQPNNPTGKLFKREILQELLELVKAKQSWLVIDESFLWFCCPIKEQSFSTLVNDNPNLILINSLTKIGGIPGLRLGFVIGAREIIKKINQVLNQWNLNVLAQRSLASTINHGFLERTCRRLNNENRWLQTKLAKFGSFKVYPWDANFYLIQLMSNFSATDIISKLAARGILVRDCGNFMGLQEGFIRIAVGKRRQNRCLIKNLRKIFQHEKSK